MKFLFSIVILTYNSEKTLDNLLNKIQLISKKNTETIVIDSESIDRTLEIVKKYKRKINNLRVIRIKKIDFNHGLTRNFAARKAKGKYICFFSQDAIPVSNSILKFYLEDFRISSKVVAIFGEHIPYDDSPFIQKLDVLCQWEKINRYTDKNGILVQTLSNPFIPYTEENRALWYALSDTAACYSKSFLLSHPFPATNYGEDLLIGKEIIEKGFSKIYDRRCSVIHSHKFNIHQYYERVKEDLTLKKQVLKLREKNNFLQKLFKILSINESIIIKGFHIIELCFYYSVKILIILDIKLENIAPISRTILKNREKPESFLA